MTTAVQRIPVQRQHAINNVDLRVYEWKGAGHTVMFLHATGFHSRCWDQVITQLPDAHVIAVDMHFHGGSSADGEVDWSRFHIDIGLLVKELDLNNIIAVGHSMGGCVAARVVAALPERFNQLVLIDPVIMDPSVRESFKDATKSIQPSEHPVAYRKNDWRSSDEMFERFRNKSPFDTWQVEVLRDYCSHALDAADENGIHQLACKPVDEAAFYLGSIDYSTIKSEIESIRTPATILRAPPPAQGKAADFSASPTWPELAQAMHCARDVYLPECNHFIPMQQPQLVADYVKQAICGEWT